MLKGRTVLAGLKVQQTSAALIIIITIVALARKELIICSSSNVFYNSSYCYRLNKTTNAMDNYNIADTMKSLGDSPQVSGPAGLYGESTCRYLYGTAQDEMGHMCNMIDRGGLNMRNLSSLANISEYNQGKWVRNCDPYLRAARHAGPEAPRTGPQDPFWYAYGRPHSDIAYDPYNGFKEGEQSPARQAQFMDGMNYFWQPSSCSLLAFNQTRMRELLASHRVLVVGDSLSVQLGFSIAHLSHLNGEVMSGAAGWLFKDAKDSEANLRVYKSYLLVNQNDYTVLPPRAYEYCMASNIPHSPRNNTPSTVQNIITSYYFTPKMCPKKTGIERHRLDYLAWPRELNKTDLLILGTGAHWHNEDKSFAAYHHMARNVVQYLAENYRGRVVFVSTIPGHYFCGQFPSPLARPVGIPEPDQYQWALPKQHEHVWGALFAQSPLASNFTYLHFDGLSSLRPDNHMGMGDCLHFCIPGVPDTWAHVFFNLLVQFLP